MLNRIKQFTASGSLFSLQVFQLLRYGTFILAGIGFTKLGLSPGQIGRFETVLLLSGMLSFFWVSGIINALLSVYPKYNEEDKRISLFNTFILLCGLSLVAAAALYIFKGGILSLIDKDGDRAFYKLAICYLICNCPSFINEYILFLNNKKWELLCYGIGTLLLTLAFTILPIAFGYGIEYAVYGIITVAILKLIFSVLLLGIYGKLQLDTTILMKGLSLSLPLMLSLFVSGSAEYIDGIIVKARFDNVGFAVYRYGAKELPVLLIIANTFSTAMIPALAANLSDGLSQLKERSTKLMHFFFPLSMALMLASPYLYKYAFNDSFLYSAFIFNIYLLLIIPRVLFPQTILTATQHSKWLVASSVLEIVINVLLSLYLSTIMGLAGIAFGTFIAYLFDKLFLMAVAYTVLRIKPVQYINLSIFAFYNILLIAAFGLGYWLLVG